METTNYHSEYFVDQETLNQMRRSFNVQNQVEKNVDEDTYTKIQKLCNKEKQERQNIIKRAKYTDDEAESAKLFKQADDLLLPSCQR